MRSRSCGPRLRQTRHTFYPLPSRFVPNQYSRAVTDDNRTIFAATFFLVGDRAVADLEYDAFISYRRSDGSQVAHWLRRELQRFRMPRSLRSTFDRKLRIYLDVAYERGTSDFYEQSIRPALLASRSLLVLATPDAIRRPGGAEDWMQREIADFAGGPNGRRVVAVRAAGEFSDPLPGDLAMRFPNIEIVDLRGASRLSFLNPIRASRLANEKLKLIAPLVDLPTDAMPRLRQEEERQQQTRLGVTAGMSLAVVSIVGGASIYAIAANLRAEKAFAENMYATSRMVSTISDSLHQTNEEESPRSKLLNQGCDLLDTLGADGGQEPEIREVLICATERALAHEKLDEFDQGRQRLDDAVNRAVRSQQRQPKFETAQGLINSRKQLVQLLERQKRDRADIEAQYVAMRDEATRFAAAYDDDRSLRLSAVEAHEQIASLQAERKEHKAAANSYTGGAAILEALDDKDETNLSWRMQLMASGAVELWQANDMIAAQALVEQALAASEKIDTKKMKATTRLDIAHVQASAFAIYRDSGDQERAKAARSKAGDLLVPIETNGEPDTEDRKRAAEIRELLQSVETAGK